jgi:hypothetical protein
MKKHHLNTFRSLVNEWWEEFLPGFHFIKYNITASIIIISYSRKNWKQVKCSKFKKAEHIQTIG